MACWICIIHEICFYTVDMSWNGLWVRIIEFHIFQLRHMPSTVNIKIEKKILKKKQNERWEALRQKNSFLSPLSFSLPLALCSPSHSHQLLNHFVAKDEGFPCDFVPKRCVLQLKFQLHWKIRICLNSFCLVLIGGPRTPCLHFKEGRGL